jgi:hypothetical protein
MANIIFTYTGRPIPPHVEHCIVQTRKYNRDTPIYFIHEYARPSYFDAYNVISCTPDLDKHNRDYVGGRIGYRDNPLWENSYIRLRLIEDVMRDKGLTNCFHYDCDVMVYTNLSGLLPYIKKPGLYITRGSYYDLVFGMSLITDADTLSSINRFMDDILLQPTQMMTRYGVSMINEMMAIRLSQCYGRPVFLLSTTPHHISPEALDYNNPTLPYLFDPAGYGQFLDGSPQNDLKSGHIDANQYIGRLIRDGQITVHFSKEQGPYIMDHVYRTIFEIQSLHIHSKRTERFLTV